VGKEAPQDSNSAWLMDHGKACRLYASGNLRSSNGGGLLLCNNGRALGLWSSTI
jgi:hypothetical protein